MWTNLGGVRGAMFVRFWAMFVRLGAMLLLVSCGQNDLYAQATKADPVDVQGRMSLGLNHSIGKKWKLEMDVQSRYFNNIQTYSGTYLSAGVQRKLSKYFDLTGEYRLAMVQQGNYNRFSGGLLCDYKWKNWELGGRALILNQIQDFDDAARPDQSEGYWRVRVQAKYKINKRLDVYADRKSVV